MKMRYLIVAYIFLGCFIISCEDNISPAAWRSTGNENNISADISGGFDAHYSAKELRYSRYDQTDNTNILNVQSRASLDNYLYNFTFQIPLKVGKYEDNFYIDSWIALGNREFRFSDGYFEVEEKTKNYVKGNFEFKAYLYDDEAEPMKVVDSVFISRGEFQIELLD